MMRSPWVLTGHYLADKGHDMWLFQDFLGH
jgi:hypothetical protein